MSSDLTKEERVLQMVKKVLTNVAKDTYTAPGLKHPLSEQTILEIRECLGLVVARETELAQDLGRDKSARPRFIDEPPSSVVVNFDAAKKDK
ncbi:MAG: segregation and condensation protein A [Gammaproteobacteria bacterium]|nr:segregation and condensation protein A [Gammaproteobacteria bacterium]